MARKQLETMMQRNVRSANSAVVTAKVRMGLERGQDSLRPVEPFTIRHLSTSDPETGTDPGLRTERANYVGAASAATRAGRPGCSAGVLRPCRPARSAGQTILFGWSSAGDKSCPQAHWRFANFAQRHTASGKVAPTPYQPRPATVFPGSRRITAYVGPKSAGRGNQSLKENRAPLAGDSARSRG